MCLGQRLCWWKRNGSEWATITIMLNLWLISISGLGFGFRLRHGFLYYAGYGKGI